MSNATLSEPPRLRRWGYQGSRACLHLRYQNLNWGLKIFDLVSCYCLGTPRGGLISKTTPLRGYQGTTLRVRRTPPKGVLEQPGKGASEGYAFEPLFRLYFYHWNGAWNPLSNNRASWSFFALVTIVTFKPFSLVNSIFCSISRNR